MKKNRLFFMFAALLVAAAVMVSCQKEQVGDFEDGLVLKALTSGQHELTYVEPLCAGDEPLEFCLGYFVSSNTTPSGKVTTQPLNIQIYVSTTYDKDEEEWIDWITKFDQNQINTPGEGSQCIEHVFSEPGKYAIKYVIDGKGYSVNDVPLEVIEEIEVVNCGCEYEGNELKAELIGTPEELEGGWYRFVVKWTFTSEDGTWAKIKGGLTSGKDGVIVESVVGAKYELVGEPERNAQVEWSGTVGECDKQEITVTFKRVWDGSCDAITGDWTAKDSAENLLAESYPVSVGECPVE
jgi:hypothetical protein